MKTKSIIIALASITLISVLVAFKGTQIQESTVQYNYMYIYDNLSNKILISTSTEFKAIDISRQKVADYSALLQLVASHQKEGWEVYNNTIHANAHNYFILRREIK